MASTDATAIPIKDQAYQVTFPIFDADGDLVSSAADLDSEISKDNGTFQDVTAEATEIAASSGVYYLDLTATEMNADVVAIIIKTSTAGAKTSPIVLYPAEGADIPVDVKSISGSPAAADNLEASAETIIVGAAESGTLSVTQMTTDLAEATNDHYNGRIIIFTSGDLIGQGTDITDYAGANGLLTFTAVTEIPGIGDTFVIV